MTIASEPHTVEMEAIELDQMLSDLTRDRKKVSSRRMQFRFRLTKNAFVVERISTDAKGKRRVAILVRRPVKSKKPMTDRRSRYEALRSKFEAAAAEHRVDPKVLSSHRVKNATASAGYWKQKPVE